MIKKMKQIIALIAFCIISSTLFSQCVNEDNVYTFTYDGKTYEVVKEQKNWSNAAACAVERNGYLVEINDPNEQEAVYDAIINGAGVSTTYTSIANGGGIAYVWIGASDQQTEGTWIWDGNNDNTGTNFWVGEGANGVNNGVAVDENYYNWGGTSNGTANEPDNYGSGQNHAAIALAGWPSGTTMLGIASEWNDIIGTSSLYFVIEKNSPSNIPSNREKMEEVNVYPNPSNGILNINYPYETIEIYDTNGRLIKQFANVKTLDISDLNKGIYFLRAVNDSQVMSKKIVIK